MTTWTRPRVGVAILMVVSMLGGVLAGRAARAADAEAGTWDARSAATYMDARLAWWVDWPSAARDHDTVCVSCHSGLPYLLARPALRAALHEPAPKPAEERILRDVIERVRAWREMEPWYPDQTRGLPKTSESRGTESVINATVLAQRDARQGVLSDDARLAFSHLWSQQMRTGPLAGAWAWLTFRLEPWEGAQSAYFGAALAAIAVGIAPGTYRSSPDIQSNILLLRTYLTRQLAEQHTLNRLMALWASARWPDLLSDEQRDAIMADVLERQRADGGWSLASLGPWHRSDGSALDAVSDGYATGLATYVLQEAGMAATHPQVQNGLTWLMAHQDKATGQWPVSSLNKQRDPASDAGRFMSDAGTAYAVLALTAAR